MPTDLQFGTRYASLADTDDALAGMMRRLRAILAAPPLTQDTFVEITAIYNNVSYVFLYLESNEAHIDYTPVLPWREAFFDNAELDAELLAAIERLRCTESDVEESRQAYLSHLRAKLTKPDLAGEQEQTVLLTEAKLMLREIADDQAGLLGRLGVRAEPRQAAAAFYKLVSGTDSAVTRGKLERAWQQVRDRRLAPLVDVVDRMVRLRHRLSTAAGHPSALAQTLQRCQVDEPTAARYLEEYLALAVANQARLDTEIRRLVGDVPRPLDHFGYSVRNLVAGATVPTFELGECLDFIFLVAGRTFGLSLSRSELASEHVLSYDVAADSGPVGQIRFDLWDTGPQPRSANSTKGILNRSDWAGLVQRPIAYVSCRFQRGEDGTSRINFQNVHSLFHEFGHAVNHLLIRRRLPNQSGLEYLPLERLENLSMWFEKWVYHPDLAQHLNLSAADRTGLELAQRIKMLEYRRSHVDRAVTAALDFEVHRRAGLGLAQAFAELDQRYGVGSYCALGDFPGYFSWPMFQANPGANFAYLWGAADSAQKFAPFLQQTIADLSSPEPIRDLFSSCLDFAEPSEQPDSAAVFAFYDDPRSTFQQWQDR